MKTAFYRQCHPDWLFLPRGISLVVSSIINKQQDPSRKVRDDTAVGAQKKLAMKPHSIIQKELI
jgi:hypothetical protein